MDNNNNTGTEEIQSNPRRETIRTQHKTQERHKRTNKNEEAMARTTQTKRKIHNTFHETETNPTRKARQPERTPKQTLNRRRKDRNKKKNGGPNQQGRACAQRTPPTTWPHRRPPLAQLRTVPSATLHLPQWHTAGHPAMLLVPHDQANAQRKKFDQQV